MKRYSIALICMILGISLPCLAKSVSQRNDDTIIHSPTLRTADGHFIDEDDIGLMLKLREHLRTTLYGIKDAQGQLTGPYTFDGKAHCLRTLTMLEKNLPTQTRNQWLTQAIDAFNAHTEDTKKRSVGTKTQQYMYIKEFCRLHNRPDSILLIWARAPEGQEDDAINIHATTFYKMSTFVVDLMNFLDVMISSCPKAKKLFLSKIPNEQERAKLAQLFDHILEQQKIKISKIQQHVRSVPEESIA